MKYRTRPGHTVESMIETIRKYVPTDGCMDARKNYCVNLNLSGSRCAMAAFLPDDSPLLEVDLSTPAASLEGADEEAMPLRPMGMRNLQRIHDNGVALH